MQSNSPKEFKGNYMLMDAALEAFTEESRELLEQMEHSLLCLEETPDNIDLINELFRAVHTLKGAAGLFGFDHVVEFTHQAENVMEKLRDQEIKVSDDLLTVLLECRDHSNTLVDKALNGNVELDRETMEKGHLLSDRLDGFLFDEGVAQQPLEVNDSKEIQELSSHADSSRANQYWHISLRFGKDVLRNGMDPLSFVRYLETIGDLVNLTVLDDGLPEMDAFDAECCYLGYEIDLNSEASKTEIESVFEFVQDDCDIFILPPHSCAESYLELIKKLPEENLRLAEIFTRSGALTEHELEEMLKQQVNRAEDDETLDAKRVGEPPVEQPLIEKPVADATVGRQKQDKQRKNDENQLVRVNARKLEELINLVGELVISGANTHLLARQSGLGALVDSTERLGGLIEDIRDTALGLRMVPIGATFDRFRRVVREFSRELHKDIDLHISGGDTELDKTVVDKIGDPLMHLVRNAIDHGIETPEQRQQVGKSAKGVVHLNAFHDSGSIVIEISDNGRGLSRDKILAKAMEKGLVAENHSLTDREVYRLIFEAGFSTADQVTNISGRGVGMDVVRRNIDALRGQIDIETDPGKASKISIRLPLTLAIIDGFLVQVGQSSFVIPLDLVDECVEYGGVVNDVYEDSQYINLRGEILPYIRLGDVFNAAFPDDQDAGQKTVRENIVITHHAGQKTGLVVDALLGEHQTVIKPLGAVFQNAKGLSGATILGSGEVAMIVDVPALVAKISETKRQKLPNHGIRSSVSNG